MPLNIINSLTIGKYAKKAADPIWVAVGGGSIIANSTNGNAWTAVAADKRGGITPTSYEEMDVAYGNGRWVAVGSGSLIAYSSNGSSWTAATTKGGITLGRGVAYGNGMWVVVGTGSIIAYSSNNGVTWTAADQMYLTTGHDVAYGTDGVGNGRWVAAGQGSFLSYSSNGINWSRATTLPYFGNYPSRVAYANGRWVAVGDGTAIAYSSNGSNWTSVPLASRGGFTFGSGVAYGTDGAGNGRWVVVGQGSVFATSPNGNEWTAAATTGGITSAGDVLASVAFKTI